MLKAIYEKLGIQSAPEALGILDKVAQLSEEEVIALGENLSRYLEDAELRGDYDETYSEGIETYRELESGTPYEAEAFNEQSTIEIGRVELNNTLGRIASINSLVNGATGDWDDEPKMSAIFHYVDYQENIDEEQRTYKDLLPAHNLPWWDDVIALKYLLNQGVILWVSPDGEGGWEVTRDATHPLDYMHDLLSLIDTKKLPASLRPVLAERLKEMERERQMIENGEEYDPGDDDDEDDDED